MPGLPDPNDRLYFVRKGNRVDITLTLHLSDHKTADELFEQFSLKLHEAADLFEQEFEKGSFECTG